MPNYQYNAVNKTGKLLRGKLEARNVGDLEKRLGRLGLSVVNSTEIKHSFSGLTIFQSKVKRDDLSQFCFYVERLVAGGVPLLEGLSDVRDSVSNATLRNTISFLIEDVEQGSTLSAAMKKYPKTFDDVFVSLIEAGEHSGELDSVLRNLGENIKWQGEIVKKTKKAFTYPIVALIVILLATYGLLVLVVPGMTKVLKELGRELEPITVALINTSEFIQNYALHMVAGFFGVWFFFFILIKTIPGIDYLIDKVKIRIPVFGQVVEKLLLSRFSNVFGLLYGSGVGVIDCLKISRGALGNKFIARGLDGVIESITNGTTLSGAFRESGLFPPLVLRMIRLGESTGGVDSAMLQIKSYYDRDANEAIETAQAAVGPLMMLIIAGLLVWVILAIYGPLYNIIGDI